MADKSKGWTSLVLALGWGEPEWWVGEGGGFYNARWDVFHKHARDKPTQQALAAGFELSLLHMYIYITLWRS